MNQNERRMLELLKRGKEEFGVVSVKAEFEAEGTRTDEFLRLLEMARRAGVNVGLKIGGCEAIRDLAECRQFGVDYIIAPMVETPYALSKFVAAKDKIFTADERADIGFLFNVETIATFLHLDAMAEMARANDIGMVFGRVDFAGSLGMDRRFVNSGEMTDFVMKAATVAAAKNVPLVVGGGVSVEAVPALSAVRDIRLDRFETRKVIFDGSVAKAANVADALALAIDFELLWLQTKRDYYNHIGAEDAPRIAMMERRSAVQAAPAAVAA